MTTDTTVTFTSGAPAATTSRIRQVGLMMAVVGIALVIVGYVVYPKHFYHTYVVGYALWMAITIGCLALYLLHNLVSGAWGFALRRLMEAGASTLPLMLVLFVPIALGAFNGSLYEWTHADIVAKDHILQHKEAWLNLPFWTVRVVAYFLIWMFFAWTTMRMNARQEKMGPGPAPLTRNLQRMSGAGLVTLVLTFTFAGIDWYKSLEPHWFSTIYGILMVAGAALGGITILTLLFTRYAEFEPIKSYINKRVLHDFGNLMFALNMFWAYISFSQFIIIWSGNVGEETPWYHVRINNGWDIVAWCLVFLHFAASFLALLSRKQKRKLGYLAGMAVWLLIMRLVDLIWVIGPSERIMLHSEGNYPLTIHWQYIASALAVGGLWLFWVTNSLKNKPLLPVYDPRMEDARFRVEHLEPHFPGATEAEDLRPA